MKQSIICSASHSIVAENPVLQQLEYGNVPRDQSNADPESYMLQSFDFPCNTHLPGMKRKQCQCQSFELGFFSPNGSTSRYVGTWYRNYPDIVVLVANRENSVTESRGVLTIANNGSLVLLDKKQRIIWSSGSTRATENPVVQLLESGNLVLREKSDVNPESYM
ncbi:G-type lectin S-receptor-like serine/threonine-protein kinase [Vitis vinifera]|uniref:G-type lectin S-receptor-like serine/threonine-protein kinase n=1 Tax=Vitis vinifera TaxID=29760 RepID=A0A438GDQ7_VITVI|nr:G-type lectin S-receptor-like serine/threonine-protein kinase [Vitis vinifera]